MKVLSGFVDVLTAGVTAGICGDVGSSSSRWNVLSAANNSTVVPDLSTGHAFYKSARLMPTGLYKLEYRVTDSATGLEGWDKVMLEVLRGEMVVIIKNGNSTLPVSSEIVLDGSYSYDLDVANETY